MLAVRMYKPKDLRVEDVPIPSPGEGEALLRILAVGICGSDIPRVNTYGAYHYPLTIGHEFSACIEALGANTAGFHTGQRVTVAPMLPCGTCRACREGQYSMCDHYDYFGSRRDGAMAEYLASPVANLLPLPDRVNDQAGAMVDPCANAVHALTQAGFQSGDSVCVYGAGPIGLFAVQCAKAMRASKVIAVDIDERKLAVAKACGADAVIDGRVETAAAAVRELLDGGANVVLDVAGTPVSQLNCIHSAAKGGRVVFVGISHRGLELDAKTVDAVMRRQLRVTGSWNSFTAPFPGADWTTSIRLMDAGQIDAGPIVSHVLPLREAPDIFRQIDEKTLFFNKVLFLPQQKA